MVKDSSLSRNLLAIAIIASLVLMGTGGMLNVILHVSVDNGKIKELRGDTEERLGGRPIDSRQVTADDEPKVDYVGYYTNGECFTTNIFRVDNSYAVKKSDFYYNYASGTEGNYKVTDNAIDGFEDAVIGMRVGENKTVLIPPEAGYGFNKTEGSGPYLSNRVLMFLIYVIYIDDGNTTDTDGDGYGDDADEFPDHGTIHYQDSDFDGLPNFMDHFPDNGSYWRDFDLDRVPDGLESDIDGDGLDNWQDAFM